MYLELAKGAFIRSRPKWLEEGERSTNYFFALEKRNFKRKALTTLHIDGVPSEDAQVISNFITSFYAKLYESKFWADDCNRFMEKIQTCIPSVDEDVKLICESELTAAEVRKALFSMKKGRHQVLMVCRLNSICTFGNLFKDLCSECIRNA